MARLGGKLAAALLLSSGLALLAGVAVAGDLAKGNPRTAVLKPTSAPYIDAHTHIDQNHAEDAVNLLLAAMDGLNGRRVFIQTEPYGPGNPGAWDVEKILPAVKEHSDKMAALGGGGTLNPMILEAYQTGNAGPEVQKKFRERAEAILAAGAVGFGELSVEHFSLPQSPVKDYEYAPIDSPLMLLLADIAAEHNVPVDMHMEALLSDIPMPPEYGPPNPKMLHANIAALERYLDHNKRAKLIWAHAGSDTLGFRTPDMMRDLLKKHDNLYLEIKFDPGFPGMDPPIGKDGKLKETWLKLYQEFPDRFIIGSDQHFDPPATVPLARAQQNALLLDQLPADVRKKIAVENALRIYGLKE